MKVTPTAIPEVLLVEPDVFGDARGFFLETWSRGKAAEHGLPTEFAQDNLSRSPQGILRGLHLQKHPHGQGKLVHVVDGEVFDVAVDVRAGSPTFGRWVGFTLSGSNHRQLYIPPGFAHGFCVTSEHAFFAYKCTTPYAPQSELGVAWDDPRLDIPWPVTQPLLSAKDAAHRPLNAIDPADLPPYAAPAKNRTLGR